VNFSVTEDGLEDQLLTMVVEQERPGMKFFLNRHAYYYEVRSPFLFISVHSFCPLTLLLNSFLLLSLFLLIVSFIVLFFFFQILLRNDLN
jgi:hypothetical protein